MANNYNNQDDDDEFSNDSWMFGGNLRPINKRHCASIDEDDHAFSEYEFDDSDNGLLDSLASTDELTKIFGIDGKKKLPSFPRRRMKKKSKSNSQTGGNIQQPTPSVPNQARTGPLFEIISRVECSPRISEKFKRHETTTLLEIKHNLNRQDIVLGIECELTKFYHALMQPFLDKCNDNDILSSTFNFEQLTVPIFIFSRKTTFDSSALQKQLYQIAQSKKGNFLDGALKLKVAIVGVGRPMNGSRGWRKNRAPMSNEDRSVIKRSIVMIENKDTSCGFRALAVAAFHLVKIRANAIPNKGEEEEDLEGDILEDLGILSQLTALDFKSMKDINKNWQLIRKSACKLQKISSDQLKQRANLPDEASLSLSNVRKVEDVLGGIKIIVVNRDTKQREYPVTMDEVPEKYVCLEYIPKSQSYPDGHYNALINLKGYMEVSNFCVRCWVGQKDSREKSHSCAGEICKKCFGTHDEPEVFEEITCNGCNTTFTSHNCYQQHRSNYRCATLHHCPKCSVNYSPRISHSCLEYPCHRCQAKYTESPHYCNLESLTLVKLRAEDRKPKIIIAYDIESQLQGLEHKPVLLVAKRTCTHFKKNAQEQEIDKENHSKTYEKSKRASAAANPDLDLDAYAPCGVCGDDEKHWMVGMKNCTNVIHSFIEYVMVQAVLADKVKGKVLVFAHNSKGYDCHFILQEFIRLGYQDIKPLMAGSKIMKLTIGNISFVDSLNLFQMGLKALPKAFGLDSELKKGDFPHRFNTPENLHRVIPWPDVSFYEPEKKKPADAVNIRKFVQQMTASGKMFDFDEELLNYCREDVKILLQSIVKFRETFIAITSLDPLTRCFTLASIALENFKCNFYDANATPIGITPQSYTEPKPHSMISDAWLDWIALGCGSPEFRKEQRVGTKWVDGAILSLNRVFEFNGCIYHGCMKCFPDPNTTSVHDSSRTMGQLYQAWLDKKKYLENLGLKVMVMWECELSALRRENLVLDQYIKDRVSYYSSLKAVGHIKPRDALFGGRTNNIKFHHEADGRTSDIKYLDFTSLYPFEVSKKSYPLGHPVVINQGFDLTMSFTGLSKCKVLPPRRLRFGVLPVKVDDRLVFALCNSCALSQSQKSCRHTDSERYITGTWTTPELRFAINDGYKIIKVYEELRYEQEQVGVFSGYIKLWMKEKQEASGWPAWCLNEEAKHRYIDLYKQHEDIDLDYSKIELNPGRRFIAKLMLNSFWGKFAQRTNMGETNILTDPKDYFQIIDDPSKEITADEMVNEDTMLIGWKYVDDDSADPGNTNVVIASFVTSYARLELLTKLKEIESVREGRILYFDTDSIIFENRAGDPEIETGDYLGQLTDEITKDYGPEARCIEFVSGGPKNYAIKIRLPDESEKVIIKAKGITLNEETSEKVTFSEMKRLVKSYIHPTQPRQEEIHVQQFQILANLKKMCVTSRYFSKVYRVVSEKRRIVGNDTVPYGYVD